MTGPDGSHGWALSRLWDLALAAFKRWAESRPPRSLGPGRLDEKGRKGGSVATLLIEYHVEDFVGWKTVFDKDPMGRRAHGATHHRIYRDSDDPNHHMLSLEFSSAQQAKAFREMLEPVWEISGAGQAWILQEVEA